MKLLNFNNLEFKREKKKRIRFYAYFINFRYNFKYLFYHPSSYYLRIDPDIKWCKTDYQKYFIKPFKWLKEDINDETA